MTAASAGREIDGLTYGGFKAEHGEPAERLIRRLKASFSGELIDFEELPAAAKAGDPAGRPDEERGN